MKLQELEVDERAAPVSIPESPVLWRGIGSEWTCTRNWTLAGLAARFAGRKVRARATDNEIDVFFKFRADELPYDQLILFDEYIESILRMSRGDRARPAYAGSISIKHDPVSSDWAGELLDECPISDWFPGMQLDEPRLWIGAPGQKSSIHNDPYDNLNAQIIGKKKFILFAPEQHGHLYPEFIHSHLWASRIDPDFPDMERFPKFASARGFVGELSPGDVLFIPKYWWHFFSATEASLNINRWIYSEVERQQCWHDQPSAKKFMDYGELLCLLENKFELLDGEGRQRHRERFEELRRGMLRLAEESKTATGVKA